MKGRRGEDDEEEERPQRKRKRASKKKAPEEIDLSIYPPEVGASFSAPCMVRLV